MGVPMVQVFMIVARQMSKPVADLVMRYGKNHPLFRNKVLVPIGRRLVNLTTRLRMKNLGLGTPTTVAPVSESAALEQASEFVQQVVIFGYTVGVFYTYQLYSKSQETPIVSKEELKKTQNELNEQIRELNDQVQQLSEQIQQLNKKSRWNIWPFSSSHDLQKTQERRQPAPPNETISRQEAMQRITTSPINYI